MINEIKDKIVPTLRFPEFKENEEWKIMPLKEVYVFKSTNSFTRDDLNYIEGEIKNIHYGDIHAKFSTQFDITNEKVPFIKPSISTEKIGIENYCIEGDMIFADASEDLKDIGKSIELVFLNNEKLLSGLHTLLARQRDHKLVIGFGGHLFLCNSIRSQIQREAQGAKVLGISATRLSNINIFYPSKKEEQRKIADCLSSLDDLITAQKQKLEALKTHKKGLMQQLFPAEGETVPKLRFKEFEDSGDWEEKRLDEICKVNPSTDKLPEHFVYVDLESVEDGILLKRKQIKLEAAPSRAQRLLQAGDVIFQMVRPYQQNNYFFIEKDNLKYVASTGYAQLRAYESQMYLYQYLHTQLFVDKVLVKCTGSNYPAINSSTLAEIIVVVPDPLEQQKIADCLSSLDDIITTQQEKIEALKVHKKGLMQALFPCDY